MDRMRFERAGLILFVLEAEPMKLFTFSFFFLAPISNLMRLAETAFLPKATYLL
jgi:hypothetical protein